MHLVALEADKWLAGYRYRGQQSVWTIDSFNLSGSHHELRQRPQCTHCGDPDLVAAQAKRPVTLVSRTKAQRCDGGHRSRPPEQVLETNRHLVSPITGVVKEIQRDQRGPAFFNSFRSGPNVVAGSCSLDGLRATLRVANGGKGTNALQAEVGALCEALERHSGMCHGDEARVRASYASLRGNAVHPDTCQLFHERQYPDRKHWNAKHSAFQQVCDPFDERAVLDWTPVWSLTERRHRMLPTAMLYFGVPQEGSRAVHADSNGNAAGSSLEDAVLQGLLELVERDAVALWWYNRTKAPAVDLTALASPWIDELREVYEGIGREVWLLDLTSDLGIPTMAALSRRVGMPREDIMFGFGAHLDPRVAAHRALAELNQLMPALLEGNPSGDYACDDGDAVRWWRTATVANQPYLRPDPAVRPRTPADFGYTPSKDLHDDVRKIQARVEELGMELLVLDQTRPDIGLPVVKVIVPGLRHFWARFAPGRLYDVPVALGRLPRPTEYHELNPFPMFL
jgi:ribosomal protein S12 methylthiotransferase accessory factor